MNNKFLIIFCVLLSLIGIYYYNNNKLTNIWDLISEKTIIIYEVNNPYEVWKKFKISYKKETKENELYNTLQINNIYDKAKLRYKLNIQILTEEEAIKSASKVLFISLHSSFKNRVIVAFFISFASSNLSCNKS